MPPQHVDVTPNSCTRVALPRFPHLPVQAAVGVLESSTSYDGSEIITVPGQVGWCYCGVLLWDVCGAWCPGKSGAG